MIVIYRLFVAPDDSLKLLLGESQPEAAGSKPGLHVERSERLSEVGLVRLELKFLPQDGPDLPKDHPQHLHHASGVSFGVCCKKSLHSFNFLRGQRTFPHRNLRANRGSLQERVNDPFKSLEVRNLARVSGKELVPKRPPDISVIFHLAILEDDEGAFLCGEGGVLAKGELSLARRCHPDLGGSYLKLKLSYFQIEISKCLYIRIFSFTGKSLFRDFLTNFQALNKSQLHLITLYLLILSIDGVASTDMFLVVVFLFCMFFCHLLCSVMFI